ncbi:type II toxin-antitoxin system Phd/YefM family antitoxin [Gracilinema caldarium]|jgi:antitoxin (DNA-binding transcriptional repressor) of toxin-antitoxin stability system|uniref:Antitoxin n=1 Tax=Gracilinema caldarium (strain ATCC 51460 / DSM 7334 / H1) TaxID=744872 RepID=F8F359_GRAC1|nr:hypothetical protein [Gracilinema caldarium]AEJ20385.1 hypothetical protein Spica_2272 [Gracilinema caldarium DSM 7334]
MKVTAMEARMKFGELLSRVLLNNEEITIERSGKMVAKLVKCTTSPDDSDNRGELLFSQARGLGKSIWQHDKTTEYIKAERDEWQ